MTRPGRWRPLRATSSSESRFMALPQRREPSFASFTTQNTFISVSGPTTAIRTESSRSEMKRDSGLRRGDQIKIIIDTFHDHRNGVYFSTNPLGARKDATSVQEGRTFNYDWNVVWRCKTSIDEKGWYAEIAIPLSLLPFKSSIDSTTWGLNICRIIMRKNEETYWAPYPAGMGRPRFRAPLPCRAVDGARRTPFPPTSRAGALHHAPGQP